MPLTPSKRNRYAEIDLPRSIRRNSFLDIMDEKDIPQQPEPDREMDVSTAPVAPPPPASLGYVADVFYPTRPIHLIGNELTAAQKARIIKNKAEALRKQAEFKRLRAQAEEQAVNEHAELLASNQVNLKEVNPKPKPFDWKKKALSMMRRKHYKTLEYLNRRVYMDNYKKSQWRDRYKYAKLNRMRYAHPRSYSRYKKTYRRSYYKPRYNRYNRYRKY